jgi:hypothetical protein
VPSNVLEPLRKTPATSKLFWELCDFDVLEEDAPDWFALESGDRLRVVGRDACGGRFCLFPVAEDDAGRLLYIDSEGSAGVIATSLSEGIRMMIALPYWRDCLKFSGGGALGEMQKAQTCLEEDLRQRRPGIDNDRKALYREFGLAAPDNPLETLHRTLAASTETRVVATRDGCPFTSLFNTFVVDDCPTWRR